MNQSTQKISFRETLALTCRTLLLWWKTQPRIVLITVISPMIQALSPFVALYLSAQLINELTNARDPHRLLVLSLWAVGTGAVLTLVNGFCARYHRYWFNDIYFQEYRIQTAKLLEIDFAKADDQHTHDLYSQIYQNVNVQEWGLVKPLRCLNSLSSSLFQIIGAVALSVSLFTKKVPEDAGALRILNHPLFLLLSLGLLLAVIFGSSSCANRVHQYFVDLAGKMKLFNRIFLVYGEVTTDYHRAADIRIYKQERLVNHYMKKTTSINDMLRQAELGSLGLFRALGSLTSHVFVGLIYVFVCLKAWAGAFGVGSITQYVGALTALSTGLSLLIQTCGTLRANTAFLRSDFALLDIPHDMYQGSLTTEKRADRKYDIEFKDVSFRYPGSETYALRHVSLKLRVGERLAVVGRNGSGKTTFIKLLCRLYDPTEGEILLNGINIRKYKYEDYMDLFSVVFQDFQLLSFPLGQNVAASQEYDGKRVQECLKKAGFTERLDSLPQGLDTCLYRDFDKAGLEISGGEAQKIALARTLYKDAPFLILDEPTAALDPVAEYQVYSKFNEIIEDKTAIYISHRLSSCRFCDEIAVFDQGEVVQKGSHEELVGDRRGKYYELWQAQAKYYT